MKAKVSANLAARLAAKLAERKRSKQAAEPPRRASTPSQASQSSKPRIQYHPLNHRPPSSPEPASGEQGAPKVPALPTGPAPPEVAAAMALARKGELGRAVQVLEHSGAHAHAAVIRLEYAYSLCGALQRIAMLREGCARTPGDTPEGKALHRALAEALLRQATVMEDGAPRRGLLIEAAGALETADEGDKAGDIYRQLGLLHRAARAYERAGAVSRLEYTLGLIEHQEQARAAVDQVEREVDDALQQGKRRLALALLQDTLGRHQQTPEQLAALGANAAGPSVRGLSRRLTRLESRMPRAGSGRLDLRHGGVEQTRVFLTSEFSIGRSPSAQLSIGGAGLSRVHVQLSVVSSMFVGTADEDAPDLVVVAIDQGSRAGSFWDGDPLDPGIPIVLDGVGELGLGFSAAVDVHPVYQGERSIVGALLRGRASGSDERWSLFLPEGGPLVLAPGRAAPARILYRAPFFELIADPETQVHLGRLPLGRGAHVELLVGDRVQLLPPTGGVIEFEVMA